MRASCGLCIESGLRRGGGERGGRLRCRGGGRVRN